jgi:hypothetical protein
VQLIMVSKGVKRAVSSGRVAVAMSAVIREIPTSWREAVLAGLGEAEERVEGRRRRVILLLLGFREGWEVRLWRTWVPSSPAPRTRIEDGGGGVGGIVVC